MIKEFCDFTQKIYGHRNVPLHRPIFSNAEKINLVSCIDSNFVSSVGKYVDEFENLFADRLKVTKAIAAVNGTSALHVALHAIGVKPDSEVLTQALTFVATANAIKYCGATPVFIDVDIDTLGMSPKSLELWLMKNTIRKNGTLINKNSNKTITACVPMHTFGFPCRIEEIAKICANYGIPLVEDAAESLGSYVGAQHTGTFGAVSAFSFNGNKIITTGGGGMIVTSDDQLGHQIKYLTTTAKKLHPYEYFHTELGFNYRMPNLNAALGVAQMEILEDILIKKKEVANLYKDYFSGSSIKFFEAIEGATANNWLNAIVLDNREGRDEFLIKTNENGVMTRPIWSLLSDLPMYQKCQNDGLKNSRWLAERVVNIPSSVPSIG